MYHCSLFNIYIYTFQFTSPSDLVLHDGCTSGSIHQASEIFNGPGRGLQCVANAVCALLHSAKTDPATWRVYDIDEILLKVICCINKLVKLTDFCLVIYQNILQLIR